MPLLPTTTPGPRRPTAAACACALVVAWLPLVARAAEPAAKLVFSDATGLPGCPDENEIRRGVAVRLGRSPFVAGAARRVRVTLAPHEKGLVGRVESFDGERALGEREVTTATRDCAGLTEALELAVALAIDPIAAMRVTPPPPPPRAIVTAHVDPEPPPAPPPEPVRAAPRRRPVDPLPEKPAPSPYALQLAGGIDLGLGTAPGISPGFSGEIGTRTSGWSWGVEARYALRGGGDVGPGTVGVALASLATNACLVLGRFDTCGLLGGGAQFADGTGLQTNASAVAPLAFAGARVGWRLELPGTAFLRLDATLLVPFTPVTLRVSGTPVWTTAPVALTLGPRLGGVLW